MKETTFLGAVFRGRELKQKQRKIMGLSRDSAHEIRLRQLEDGMRTIVHALQFHDVSIEAIDKKSALFKSLIENHGQANEAIEEKMKLDEERFAAIELQLTQITALIQMLANDRKNNK